MPTKKTTSKRAPASKTRVVKKTEASTSNSSKSNGINREDHLHLFIGAVLLLIGLRWLRQWILGLVFIIVGLLFVIGYFESGKK